MASKLLKHSKLLPLPLSGQTRQSLLASRHQAQNFDTDGDEPMRAYFSKFKFSQLAMPALFLGRLLNLPAAVQAHGVKIGAVGPMIGAGASWGISRRPLLILRLPGRMPMVGSRCVTASAR